MSPNGRVGRQSELYSSDPYAEPSLLFRGLAGPRFEEVAPRGGTRPLLISTGGSIPIVTTLTGRGIPAIVTGFSLSESNIHSPNERIPAEYLDLGARTVRELFLRLAQLG